MYRTIEQHIDKIDDIRREICSVAYELNGKPDASLVQALRKVMVTMARILQAFHHTFDHPIQVESLSENEHDLLVWGSTYDQSFRDCYAILKQHEGNHHE